MIRWIEGVIARAAASYRADPRFLAVLRICYGAWVIVLPVDIMWVGKIPDGFVNPRPGLFWALTETPPESVLFAISVVRFALAAALMLGVYTVPVSIALSGCMVLAAGISYSFSKVDHFILFELVPAFLAFAGWGARWSLDALLRQRQTPSATRGMPILLFALTIGWAMFSAAIPKVMGGWLDPAREATHGYIARDVATAEKLGPLGSWILTVDVDPMWKLLDYATIVAEGTLLFLVLAPLLFRLWLLVLGGFHVAVYLTLGISFADYVLVYAVFFSPAVVWAATRVRDRAPMRPRAPEAER